MSRSGWDWAEVRVLARQLLARRESIEPGLLNTLRTDITSAVAEREDLVIAYQDRDDLITGCTISGAYLRRNGTGLPRIVIARTTRERGERFTLGHEFLHHLIDGDAQLADLLFRQQDRGHALEEDICDSGAAYLLVSGADVDKALGPDHDRITARAVAALYHLCQGSIEMCAVSLATRMTVPGYILICNNAGPETDAARVEIRFCARGPGANTNVLRDVQQHAQFATARRNGATDGPVRLQSSEGDWKELHADIVATSDSLICVLAPSGSDVAECC